MMKCFSESKVSLMKRFRVAGFLLNHPDPFLALRKKSILG